MPYVDAFGVSAPPPISACAFQSASYGSTPALAGWRGIGLVFGLDFQAARGMLTPKPSFEQLRKGGLDNKGFGHVFEHGVLSHGKNFHFNSAHSRRHGPDAVQFPAGNAHSVWRPDKGWGEDVFADFGAEISCILRAC